MFPASEACSNGKVSGCGVGHEAGPTLDTGMEELFIIEDQAYDVK